jgi:hypothetical protein
VTDRGLVYVDRMGILPGFRGDIFISYAQVDNLCLADEDKGWVTDFHNTIYMRLLQELRREPAIWRDDRDLDGRVSDNAISSAINNSAIFLAILSPAYLESAYCLKEARDFCSYQHPAFELTQGEFSRVVVVSLSDAMSLQELPEPLKQAPRVAFCETDAATRNQRLFTKPRRSDADPYWEKINRVVRHLASIIREMQRGPRQGPEVALLSDAQAAHLPVYLAEATDDLLRERQETLELLQRGSGRVAIAVEPQRSILQAVSVRRSCQEGLKKAATSIHLISATAGRIWGDAGKPLPQFELELALEGCGNRPLVWIPPDLPEGLNADPAWHEFLRRLKSGALVTAGGRTPEVFEMPFDRFLCQLDSRLFPSAAGVRRDVRRKQPGSVLVYVSYKTTDEVPVTTLIEHLRSRKYAVARLDHGGATADIDQRHQTNLRFCDGLVVSYGPGGLSWAEAIVLKARMQALQVSRPKRLGVLGTRTGTGDEFGLADDLLVSIRLKPSNGFEGLDDFLAAIEEDSRVP